MKIFNADFDDVQDEMRWNQVELGKLGNPAYVLQRERLIQIRMCRTEKQYFEEISPCF
jgi:hypothetical protein